LFLNQAKTIAAPRNKDTVLICFGGADPKNLTQQTLEIVSSIPAFKSIIVVTGAAFQFGAEIDAIVSVNPAVEYYNAIAEAEMLSLMLRAGLAIVPASGILYETMAAGCLIISGYYVDNQKILYERLKGAGAFIAAGNFSKTEIEDAIAKSLKPGSKPLTLIDGQSDKNIKRSFYDVLTGMRKVEPVDCECLFNWVNDTTVRANAFNTQTIAFESHKAWFGRKLTDPNCNIFILTVADENAGMIRFDTENQVATISYLIAENYRGMGLGGLIVKKGIDVFIKENKANSLTALVKHLNEASLKVFRRLGFTESVESNGDYGNVHIFGLKL
jgi:RimJ/RimL family protein N-acetyltransferase